MFFELHFRKRQACKQRYWCWFVRAYLKKVTSIRKYILTLFSISVNASMDALNALLPNKGHHLQIHIRQWRSFVFTPTGLSCLALKSNSFLFRTVFQISKFVFNVFEAPPDWGHRIDTVQHCVPGDIPMELRIMSPVSAPPLLLILQFHPLWNFRPSSSVVSCFSGFYKNFAVNLWIHYWHKKNEN